MIVYTPRHDDDAYDVFKYRILKIYQYCITIITTITITAAATAAQNPEQQHTEFSLVLCSTKKRMYIIVMLLSFMMFEKLEPRKGLKLIALTNLILDLCFVIFHNFSSKDSTQ